MTLNSIHNGTIRWHSGNDFFSDSSSDENLLLLKISLLTLITGDEEGEGEGWEERRRKENSFYWSMDQEYAPRKKRGWVCTLYIVRGGYSYTGYTWIFRGTLRIFPSFSWYSWFLALVNYLNVKQSHPLWVTLETN